MIGSEVSPIWPQLATVTPMQAKSTFPVAMASTGAVALLVMTGCVPTSESGLRETETAEGAPQPSPSEESHSTDESTTVDEGTDVVELGNGHLTFEIPQSWDAEFHDMTEQIIAEGSAPEFNEEPAQQAVITNPDETIHLDVYTNIPWPDVVAVDPEEVELLHAEPFDMGYETGEEGERMWLRSIIGENPEFVDGRPTLGMFDTRFAEDQYVLVIAPYYGKADLGPPDEIGGGMTSFRFPFSEETAGAWWDESITIAAGTIDQSSAEQITGAEGFEAMQAVVETEEYDQLFEVVNSFQIHVDTEEARSATFAPGAADVADAAEGNDHRN